MSRAPRLLNFLFPVCSVLLLIGHPVRAQVPQVISYQGRVIVGSTNFDGTGSFKFALMNNANGQTLWSNDGSSVNGSEPTKAVSIAVSSGLYSVLLGDSTVTNMTPIANSVFSNSDVRLRVWFNDGTHGSQLLSPDQRIAAVGYAMIAANVADGSISSAKIAAGAVGSTQLAAGAVSASKIDRSTVQQRITGSAPAGSFIQSVNADGTLVTAPISTGSGLMNFGGTISIDSTIPRLVSPNVFTATNSFSAVGIGTTTPSLPLEVTGTNGESAMFSSTINPNNLLIKGSVGTAGGIGVQTDSHDLLHTATALLSNSVAVTDGYYWYNHSVSASEFVVESNYNTGGGVKQNELYWQNESAYRAFQSRWQPVAGIAETAVFGGFVVTGDGLKLAAPNPVLAEFYQDKPRDFAILNVYNSDATSRGAMVVIGGKVNSYEGKGYNIGNDLLSNGGQNFFITNRPLGTHPFFIDGSDHIGVGTLSPFAKLAVVGTGVDDVFDLNSSTAQRLLTVTNAGNVGIGTSTPAATLEVAPNATTLADHWSVRSSQRWKTNIQTIQNALDQVRKLRGVTYDWKESHNKDIGLIAEEVGRVFPEIVTYEPNGVDARSVDYQRLVAVLIEAVKEQDQEIAELREKVETWSHTQPTAPPEGK
jgi:hypothetical protein